MHVHSSHLEYILHMAGRPRNSLQIVDVFLEPHEVIATVPDLITLGGDLNNKLSILQ